MQVIAAKKPAYKVDSLIFYIQKGFQPGTVEGNCSIYAIDSSSPSNTPVWEFTAQDCLFSVLWGDDLEYAAISEDGSIVTFAVQVQKPDGTNPITFYAFDGQTGKVFFTHTWGEDNIQAVTFGSAISANNEIALMHVGIELSPPYFVYVYNLTNSSIMGNVSTFWNVESALSYDGTFIVTDLGDSVGTLLKYDPVIKNYTIAGQLQPFFGPSGETDWLPQVFHFSVYEGYEYLTSAWITLDLSVLEIVVYNISGTTFPSAPIIASYETPRSPTWPQNPELAAAGRYAALATNGGDNIPTAVVLDFITNTTVLSHISVGSMNDIDIVQDATNTYVASSGCVTLGGCQGDGSEAFFWKL
jgi:hypothetical protein